MLLKSHNKQLTLLRAGERQLRETRREQMIITPMYWGLRVKKTKHVPSSSWSAASPSPIEQRTSHCFISTDVVSCASEDQGKEIVVPLFHRGARPRRLHSGRLCSRFHWQDSPPLKAVWKHRDTWCVAFHLQPKTRMSGLARLSMGEFVLRLVFSDQSDGLWAHLVPEPQAMKNLMLTTHQVLHFQPSALYLNSFTGVRGPWQGIQLR